jgi:hypothetical protein
MQSTSSLAVGEQILTVGEGHRPPLAGHRSTASNSFNQAFVDFTDDPLAHRRAAREVFADQLERPTVVEQLPNIVGIDPAHVVLPRAPRLARC